MAPAMFDGEDWFPELEAELLTTPSFMEEIDKEVTEFAKYLAAMPDAKR